MFDERSGSPLMFDYERDFNRLNSIGQLIIPLKEQEEEGIFFPTIFGEIHTKAKDLQVKGFEEMMIPLVQSTNTYIEKSSAEEAFKFWNSSEDAMWRMYPILIGNNIYRGASGIIIKQNGQPLMITGNITAVGFLDATSFCAYFDRTILTEDDPMSKFLLKKILPYLVQLQIWKHGQPLPVHIKIANLESMINFTTAPREPAFTKVSIRDTLRSNLEEILLNMGLE